MGVWTTAPITLRAYAVLSVAWPVASAAGGAKPLWVHLVGIFLNALIAYFLLRGVRWLWWFSVIADGLSVLSGLAGEIAWYFTVGSAVLFVLLLLPHTRRYFFYREAARQATA